MYSKMKNGFLAKRKTVFHPYKTFCIKTLTLFYKEGYINGYRLSPTNSKKIEIFLRYSNGKPTLSKIFSVSKPGRRVYLSISDIWKLNTSLRTLILSTSKGILSDKECRKFHIGGELLCIIE